MGHTGLNKTLHIIGKHHNGLCEHCQDEESVEHILSHFQKYLTEREILKEEIRKKGKMKVNIKDILNGDNNESLINYLRRTGLINRI